MKNRIAWKLTLYFAVALLIFAIGIGASFAHFFRQHTIDIKKKEMQVRAVKIAEVISDNMEFLQHRYGGSISSSRFIRYLDNVTMEYVWVVDEKRNLNMNPEGHMRSGHMRHHAAMLAADQRQAYNDYLPQTLQGKVEEVFRGGHFTLEEYNPALEDIVVTVGVPAYNKNGEVKAAVLLNAPVRGIREAAWEGVRILLISCLFALAAVFLLSVVLSWRFTKPLNLMKNIAERLARQDYTARCNLTQQDEIGDLGKTLDMLSERLQLADAESRKLEQLRREFIANISHELRTPVTVIRGSLEALKDGVVEDPREVAEYHEQMLKESVFLQRLINDLLDLSRLQNTDFPIEKEPLNFCEVIQDAVRGSQRLGQQRQISIEPSLDTDVYALSGDYGRLRQMLMIFLHNSVKFSAPGSSVQVILKGNCLTVLDHGCGMKEEDLAHAFDRFYKARNEKNKSGSGLGLAIAKQIALRHDMRLELASKEGSFTQITIELPPKQEVENNGVRMS